MTLHIQSLLTDWLMLTEMVELGVLVPYPEEGRDANDQRRPSDLRQQTEANGSALKVTLTATTKLFGQGQICKNCPWKHKMGLVLRFAKSNVM